MRTTSSGQRDAHVHHQTVVMAHKSLTRPPSWAADLRLPAKILYFSKKFARNKFNTNQYPKRISAPRAPGI